MDKEFEIKPLDRSTLKEQIVVYKQAFNSTKNEDEIFLIWNNKHYMNPLGDSLVFGAYHDGKLVGMNSYMPVEYQYQGKVIPMLQSCESGVIPEYQGKGIWSKVVRGAIDFIFNQTKYQAVIGFPNYRNSYPGFQKMNWETLFNMNNYVMINNPKLFSKSIFKGKKILQLFGGFIVLQRIGLCFPGCGYGKYSIGGCGLDELLWNDDNNVLSVTHTNELLNWKKKYKGIKTIAIREGSGVQASCIYSISEYNGERIIKIEKCVVANNATMTLKKAIALFCKFFAKEYRDVVFIRVWSMPQSDMTSALKKLVFMKSSHPNPFIIKQEGNEYSNKKWNLSFFDLD